MKFSFGSDSEPGKTVEVKLTDKSADSPVGLVAEFPAAPTIKLTQPPGGAGEVTIAQLPLVVRLGTGVKHFGNGVEVSVTQVELYDPAKPGDKERAAAAAFDWFYALMQNRGGQLSMMLSEVQRVNASCQFDMSRGWQPAGSAAPPAQPVAQNPLVPKTFP